MGVARFAHVNVLVLMADEVYQENVFTDHPFQSLSRVIKELGLSVEVASMHSLSKGFLGECGVRGGYAAFENFEADVMAQFVKRSRSSSAPTPLASSPSVSWSDRRWPTPSRSMTQRSQQCLPDCASV